MRDFFSEDEVVITVARLTRVQLVRFVESDFIKPQRQNDGYVFSAIDIARLELLCDLSEDLGLDETAIGIVISLIDQLHAARQDLAAIAQVIDALPVDLRNRIDTTLKQG